MKMKITVQGVAYDVEVDVVDGSVSTVAASAPRVAAVASAPITVPSAPSSTPSAAPAGGNVVNAPVGGTIVSIAVKAGEKVTSGSELLILEAMKMQTSIAAPMDAVIKKVHVTAGDVVRDNQLLVEFE